LFKEKTPGPIVTRGNEKKKGSEKGCDDKPIPQQKNKIVLMGTRRLRQKATPYTKLTETAKHQRKANKHTGGRKWRLEKRGARNDIE